MGDPSSTPPLAMWAGIECTVNRVGDRYFDQLERSGHARSDRVEDLERLAELGVRTLRYPILWERTLDDAGWRWADERMVRLRELGIAPIVGLVHHGSGPRHTSLVDDAFPQQLARFAGAVAARYPWVTAFTPVNEPLTTARFSALYGHWYPHAQSAALFARALVNQCKATVLAMGAIRSITPGAQLITTEDLGKTHSAPALAYQARFENERRWASNDLLCGHRVEGVPEAELAWFADHPCPPDLIGCNYYVTSERYLADDLAAWPAHEHGGNDRDRYADVAAARATRLTGLAGLLGECHARFGLPMAITEAHLGCDIDEQVRWLVHVYDEVVRARAAGLPVTALTAWAAFGSFDWHCLVTRDEGHYEPGLFDVSGGRVRATALAEVFAELAAGRRPPHPALAQAGWWA